MREDIHSGHPPSVDGVRSGWHVGPASSLNATSEKPWIATIYPSDESCRAERR